MQTLPINTTSASFIQSVQLDDGISTLPVRIKLRWNSRIGATSEGQWTISIYDSLGGSLVLGIPLVINMDMMTRFAKAELGKGVFICTHIDGPTSEVGREDLNDGKASIHYLTEAEYASLT